MTGMKLKLLALSLIVFLVAPMAVGIIGAGHVCEGQDCLICAAIRRTVLSFEAVLMLGAGILLCAKRFACRPADCESILLPTLVGVRVRLND